MAGSRTSSIVNHTTLWKLLLDDLQKEDNGQLGWNWWSLKNNKIGWTFKHLVIPSCLVVQCRKFTTLGDPVLSCAGTLGRYFTTLGNPVLSCAGTLGRYFTTLGNPVLSCAGTLGGYFTTLGNPVLSFDSSLSRLKKRSRSHVMIPLVWGWRGEAWTRVQVLISPVLHSRWQPCVISCVIVSHPTS
jgi:hypothetical protein